MAILARWQATIVDEDGNILPGASVEVRHETSGSPLATLFSDRDGLVSIGNPFVADAEGFAAFHTAGGAYKITATYGAFSRVWRYVGIGTASESDALSEGSGLSLPALSAINWNGGDVLITHSPNLLAFSGAASGYTFDNTLISSGSTAAYVGYNATSTDAGAAAGPILLLDRNSASPANADVLGQVLLRGRDSAGNATDYATINGGAATVTDGAEDGSITLQLMQASVLTNTLVLEKTALRPSSATPALTLGSAAVPFASTFTTTIELGAASDTTLARASAGDVNVEGNRMFRVGGADVPVADGGTGVSSFTTYAVICGGTTTTGALQSIAAVGSAGQVLTSNGAGALPTFQGTTGSALTLLTSGTVSAAATLDLVLTTYTTYRGLIFELINFIPATDDNELLCRFSTNGGSSYDSAANNYSYTHTVGVNGVEETQSSTTVTEIRVAGSTTGSVGIGNGAAEGLSCTLKLMDQTNTAVKTRITVDGGYYAAGDLPVSLMSTGFRNLAQDTDAIRLFFTTGNITSGKYAVYGLS
jgi:hypothetical protein